MEQFQYFTNRLLGYCGGIYMGCADQEVMSCGIHTQMVEDCVECQWTIFNQTPQTIYQTDQVVSGSGTIDVINSTAGLTEVTIVFRLFDSEVTHFTLGSKQCLAFTAVGFDEVTVQGNGTEALESAAGHFSLTLRYQAY
jgi:hypothetical protein